MTPRVAAMAALESGAPVVAISISDDGLRLTVSEPLVVLTAGQLAELRHLEERDRALGVTDPIDAAGYIAATIGEAFDARKRAELLLGPDERLDISTGTVRIVRV